MLNNDDAATENEEYDLAMPIFAFKQMVSQTKPDKNLKCHNLIGIDWMPILQKAVAQSEGISEFKINFNC